MGKQDVIEIEILADGTVKWSSDAIGGLNHQNAEAFARALAGALGGETTIEAKRGVHHHHHHHHHGSEHKH